MSERESVRRGEAAEEEIQDEAQVSTSAATGNEALDEDVDAILDEIDEVLESNAAEWVQGFVQKGGE